MTMKNTQVMAYVREAVGYYYDIIIDEYLGDTRVRMGKDRHAWSRVLLESLSGVCNLHNLDYYVDESGIVIYPQSKAVK